MHASINPWKRALITGKPEIPSAAFLVITAMLLIAGGCGGSAAPQAPAKDAANPAPQSDASPAKLEPETVADSAAESEAVAKHESPKPQGIHWAPASRFYLNVVSNMTMTAPDESKNGLETDTRLAYTWRRDGDQAELSLGLLGVEIVQDGVRMMVSEQSRDRFRHQQGDENIDMTYDEANVDLQQILRESFDVVLLKVKLDENGRVLEETVVAGPHAQGILENGVLANARLFQAPYYPAAKSWKSACRISMGSGQFADGELSYQPVDDDPAAKGLHKVSVAGEAKGSGKLPGGAEIRDALYRVDGWQSFDSNAGDWSEGQWNIEVSFDVYVEDAKVSSAKGTMRLSLQRLDDAQPPAESTESN